MHPGSCTEDGLHISPRMSYLCLGCVTGGLLAWWACMVVGIIPAAAGIGSFITSFGQDEQNKQTSLLKVFVPTAK